MLSNKINHIKMSLAVSGDAVVVITVTIGEIELNFIKEKTVKVFS